MNTNEQKCQQFHQLAKELEYKNVFWISEKQDIKLKEWTEAIYKVFNKFPSLYFTFHQDGIGLHIRVYDDVSKQSIDLTDLEEF